MKVADIMKPHPRTIGAEDELILARDLMVWAGIRHLPVLRGDALVGILSQRDVLAHLAKVGEGEGGGRGDPVEMAMRGPPQTCAPTDSVAEVAGRLAAAKIGCLLVTELGKLVGIVAVSDVLEAQVRSALAPARGGPTVADAMTRDVQVAHPDDRLLDAAARMRQHRIRHLPVVDGDGHMLGMLSDRDVRAAVGSPARAFFPEPPPAVQLLRVQSAMTRPGIAVAPGAHCVDVARYFADLSVSAVAVVDERDAVIGMLSYIDVLRAVTA